MSSCEQSKSAAKPVTRVDVRRAAMNLLARREHSYLELQRKLTKRFPTQPDLIPPELDRLKAEGLQSDARLAEAYISARSARGQGPAKIKAELQEKGVAKHIITSAFQASNLDWPNLAQQAAKKKFPTHFDPTPTQLPLKEKARITRFLLQRGFTSHQLPRLP